MYSLVCQSDISKWHVDFDVDVGHLNALTQASLHAARVLLAFTHIEVTLCGHGVAESYTKKDIANLLDAVEARKLPYKAPPHQPKNVKKVADEIDRPCSAQH